MGPWRTGDRGTCAARNQSPLPKVPTVTEVGYLCVTGLFRVLVPQSPNEHRDKIVFDVYIFNGKKMFTLCPEKQKYKPQNDQ